MTVSVAKRRTISPRPLRLARNVVLVAVGSVIAYPLWGAAVLLLTAVFCKPLSYAGPLSGHGELYTATVIGHFAMVFVYTLTALVIGVYVKKTLTTVTVMVCLLGFWLVPFSSDPTALVIIALLATGLAAIGARCGVRTAECHLEYLLSYVLFTLTVLALMLYNEPIYNALPDGVREYLTGLDLLD